MNKYDREILLTMIIGDGYITKGSPRGYFFGMTHSPKQLDYLQWKMNLIDESNILKNKGVLLNYSVKLKDKTYKQHSARWCDVATLKPYYNLIYADSKKNISWILKEMASPICMAIWFMDDGSVYKVKKKHKDGSEYFLRPTTKLCTHSYTEEQNKEILRWFKDNYDIEGRITTETKRNRINQPKYFYLNFNSENTKKIWDIIEPYILKISSMREKFAYIIDYYSKSNRTS